MTKLLTVKICSTNIVLQKKHLMLSLMWYSHHSTANDIALVHFRPATSTSYTSPRWHHWCKLHRPCQRSATRSGDR